MSAIEAQRRVAVKAAIVARSPISRVARRVGVAYVVAAIAAPPVTAAVLALAGHWDPEPVTPSGPVVVEHQCMNGRIQYGIDTGRPDGLLLAKDTGVSC